MNPHFPEASFAQAYAVADAVLYEGYMLYPYRSSSVKNKVRWQFGVLTPRAFSETNGSERWRTHTECLIDAGSSSTLCVRLRCLQLQHRAVEAAVASPSERAATFEPAECLVVGGRQYVAWDEAVEQVVDISPLELTSLVGAPHVESFSFAPGEDVEPISGGGQDPAGRFVRRRNPIYGTIEVSAEALDIAQSQLIKLTIGVANASAWHGAGASRDEVLGHSLIAVHTMLAVADATFISLLDPPEWARAAVAGCHQDGMFPVLIGHDDVVLSSPIILYDHPEVAPESPGDLFDATEIDEILALRIMTLTDAEKSEARDTDLRAATIIDRCDDMTPEAWERLHGKMRATGSTEPQSAPWWDPSVDAMVDPWSDTVIIGGIEVAKGTSVRLRPSRRSDAQDLFLQGLRATVAGVFKDVDGNLQVAVTVDDDPANVELAWQGRFLFFHPEEVEPSLDLAGEADRR